MSEQNNPNDPQDNEMLSNPPTPDGQNNETDQTNEDSGGKKETQLKTWLRVNLDKGLPLGTPNRANATKQILIQLNNKLMKGQKSIHHILTAEEYHSMAKCARCNGCTMYLVRCRPTESEEFPEPKHTYCLDCIGKYELENNTVLPCRRPHQAKHSCGGSSPDFIPLSVEEYRRILNGVINCPKCQLQVPTNQWALHLCDENDTERVRELIALQPIPAAITNQINEAQRLLEEQLERNQELQRQLDEQIKTSRQIQHQLDQQSERTNEAIESYNGQCQRTREVNEHLEQHMEGTKKLLKEKENTVTALSNQNNQLRTRVVELETRVQALERDPRTPRAPCPPSPTVHEAMETAMTYKIDLQMTRQELKEQKEKAAAERTEFENRIQAIMRNMVNNETRVREEARALYAEQLRTVQNFAEGIAQRNTLKERINNQTVQLALHKGRIDVLTAQLHQRITRALEEGDATPFRVIANCMDNRRALRPPPRNLTLVFYDNRLPGGRHQFENYGTASRVADILPSLSRHLNEPQNNINIIAFGYQILTRNDMTQNLLWGDVAFNELNETHQKATWAFSVLTNEELQYFRQPGAMSRRYINLIMEQVGTTENDITATIDMHAPLQEQMPLLRETAIEAERASIANNRTLLEQAGENLRQQTNQLLERIGRVIAQIQVPTPPTQAIVRPIPQRVSTHRQITFQVDNPTPSSSSASGSAVGEHSQQGVTASLPRNFQTRLGASATPQNTRNVTDWLHQWGSEQGVVPLGGQPSTSRNNNSAATVHNADVQKAVQNLKKTTPKPLTTQIGRSVDTPSPPPIGPPSKKAKTAAPETAPKTPHSKIKKRGVSTTPTASTPIVEDRRRRQLQYLSDQEQDELRREQSSGSTTIPEVTLDDSDDGRLVVDETPPRKKGQNKDNDRDPSPGSGDEASRGGE